MAHSRSCMEPFRLRLYELTPLLIRWILTSQVLHLHATLSSGHIILGAGFCKADTIFSGKIRCSALSASNPALLQRAGLLEACLFEPCSLTAWADVGARLVPAAALLEGVSVLVMTHVCRSVRPTSWRVAFARPQ